MKAILITFVLFLSVGASADEAEVRDPREFFFHQTFGDLTEELQLAKTEGKKGILLFFEAEGCPY